MNPEPEEQVQGVPVSELTYSEASRELDSIVEFFEQREVDVDQLVSRLERATAIVDELDRRVRSTRAQVEELVPRLEAVSRRERQLDTADSEVRAAGELRGEDQDQDDEEYEDEAMAEEDLEEEYEVWDDEGAEDPQGRASKDASTEQPLF